MAIFRSTNITAINAQALTDTVAYAANTVNIEGSSDVTVLVTYLTGAAETNNILHLKFKTASAQRSTTTGQIVETDLYDMTLGSASGGVVTLEDADYKITGAAAATTYKKSFPIQLQDCLLSIGVYEEGVAANPGTVTVKLIIVNKYQ